MGKLCQTFQSPYKPLQASMLFHATCLPLSEFCDHCDCGPISKNIFLFLNLLMQKILFNKKHWFQLLSTKNDWIISLFLISIILISLLAIPSSLLSVGKKQPLTFDENFIAVPHQVTKREKVLFLFLLSVFLSFFYCFRFLAYWDHYC